MLIRDKVYIVNCNICLSLQLRHSFENLETIIIIIIIVIIIINITIIIIIIIYFIIIKKNSKVRNLKDDGRFMES